MALSAVSLRNGCVILTSAPTSVGTPAWDLPKAHVGSHAPSHVATWVATGTVMMLGVASRLANRRQAAACGAGRSGTRRVALTAAPRAMWQTQGGNDRKALEKMWELPAASTEEEAAKIAIAADAVSAATDPSGVAESKTEADKQSEAVTIAAAIAALAVVIMYIQEYQLRSPSVQRDSCTALLCDWTLRGSHWLTSDGLNVTEACYWPTYIAALLLMVLFRQLWPDRRVLNLHFGR